MYKINYILLNNLILSKLKTEASLFDFLWSGLLALNKLMLGQSLVALGELNFTLSDLINYRKKGSNQIHPCLYLKPYS